MAGSEPWIGNAERSSLVLLEVLSRNGMGVLKKTTRNFKLESVTVEIRRENFGNKRHNRYNLSKLKCFQAYWKCWIHRWTHEWIYCNNSSKYKISANNAEFAERSFPYTVTVDIIWIQDSSLKNVCSNLYFWGRARMTAWVLWQIMCLCSNFWKAKEYGALLHNT